MKSHRTFMSSLVSAVLAFAAVASAVPLGTGITYQGRLTDNGVAPTGIYDLQFTLWDALTGGAQVSGSAADTVDNATVTNGLFTVMINDAGEFGPNAFTGDARWVQIGVRPGASAGPFTILSPRQPLTAAPYALFALNTDAPGFWSANGTHIFNSNGGSVGVGTNNPQFDLHVRRSVFSVANQPPARFGVHWREAPLGGPVTEEWLSTRVGGSFIQPIGQEGAHLIRKAGTNLHVSTETTMNAGPVTPQLTIKDNGRVGIGTTNPERVLHTVGNAVLFERASNDAAVILRNTTEGVINALFGLRSTGDDDGFAFVTDQNSVVTAAFKSGNVGIGTSSPSARLHVSGSGEQTAQFNQFGNDPGVVITSISANTIYPALSVNGFSNNAPALSVTGVARCSVLEITGADMAEKFPVSHNDNVKPGMVMEIDPDNAGKLRLAHGAYSHRVAGVVSGAGDIPVGAILGNLPGHEDAPAIALSGRVWVYCDASESSIEPGDLLTTSNTAGHAMKAADRELAHGAILGKAMTSLREGTGLVLVLVSLQ